MFSYSVGVEDLINHCRSFKRPYNCSTTHSVARLVSLCPPRRLEVRRRRSINATALLSHVRSLGQHPQSHPYPRCQRSLKSRLDNMSPVQRYTLLLHRFVYWLNPDSENAISDIPSALCFCTLFPRPFAFGMSMCISAVRIDGHVNDRGRGDWKRTDLRRLYLHLPCLKNVQLSPRGHT